MVRRATRVVLLLGITALSLSACVVDPYPAQPAYAYPGPYYAAPAPYYAPAPVYRPCCATYFSFDYSSRGYGGHHGWGHDRRHWR